MSGTEYAGVIGLYIDTAKTYAQFATGALVLSVTFRERILGETGPQRPTLLLIISWVLFLVSIACSALYPYLAVKALAYQLSSSAEEQAKAAKIWEYLPLLLPQNVYGVMAGSFFIGAATLVSASAQQLFAASHSRSKPSVPAQADRH